jgi:hypothetical protein
MGMIGRPTRVHARTGRQRRGWAGQSLVELTFVVPVALILFVGIADLGRVFAVGVAVEAATRNAAETVANEYVATPPGPLDAAAPPNGAYYAALRTRAASVVCAELRDFPNTNYDSGTNSCPDMPVVLVCIHDLADDGCASQASPGSSGIPASCTSLTSPPSNGQTASADGSLPRYVEVRTCYRFSSLLHLPFFSFGEIWLQRTRLFVIPCWFALGGAECG